MARGFACTVFLVEFYCWLSDGILACFAGDRGLNPQHRYYDNFTTLLESYFWIWLLLSKDPQPSHVVCLQSGDFTAIANMGWAHCLLIFHTVSSANTHVKISQLVTSLQTRCQQGLFALLVPSCEQVVLNLMTTCNKLEENIRLVTRLF